MAVPGYIVGWPVAHGVCMLQKGNAMPHLMPHLLYVSATEPTTAWASISAALRQAAANVLTGTPRHAIRGIGGVGFGGYPAQCNRVRVTMSRNRIAEAGEVPIFLQGGIAEGQETVADNAVVTPLLANDLPAMSGKPSVLLNDGLAGNAVYVEYNVPRKLDR
jgi:hypothetical protein